MDSTDMFARGRRVCQALRLCRYGDRRVWRRLVDLAWVFSLLLGAGPRAHAEQMPAEPSAYSIGPQDVLDITVWGQPDLSGSFSVEADGTLTFPLAGRIVAGRRSVGEVEAELRTRLSDRYVKNPQIRVAVGQYRSQQIFLMGEVQKPGSYPLTGGVSLIEALARAGSMSQNAGTEALIVRPAPNAASAGPTRPDDQQAATAEIIRVDLDELQRGNLTTNIALRAGDTVFVPRGESVFVFGPVNRPGEYALRRPGTTVLQVLSLAGGLTERGSTRRIRLVRRVSGEPEPKEIKVKLSDLVKTGDTVVVGERVF